MDEIKPAHYVTKEECEEMIEDAIRQHNRNASIISMCLGILFLALFAEGFFACDWYDPSVYGGDRC